MLIPMDENMSGRSRDSLCILHLSDLQFGDFFLENENQKKFDLKKLVRDLSTSIKDFETQKKLKIDVLIISGDLGSKGLNSDYSDAKIFLDELCSSLKIRKQNVVIVPGNHEINWNIACKEDKKKFTDYIDFLDDFFKDEEGHEKGTIDFFRVIPEFRLIFGCFNTSKKIMILEENGKPKLNELTDFGLVDEDQFATLYDKLPEDKEDYLKIAVFHHNYINIENNSSFLHNWYQFFSRLIQSNFLIGLCGHIHDQSYISTRINERTFHIFSAGSLSAKTSELPTATAYSFNILSLGFGTFEKIILSIFRYNAISKIWSFEDKQIPLDTTISPSRIGEKINNPFGKTSAEDMETNLSDFFVEEVDHIKMLEVPNSCFIFGRRGSGKSMNFHYMKFENTIKRWSMDEKNKCLGNSGLYIGILIPCKSNIFTKFHFSHLLEELKLDESFVVEIIEYYMVRVLFEAVLDSLLKNLSDFFQTIIVRKEKLGKFSFQNAEIQNILENEKEDTLSTRLNQLKRSLFTEEQKFLEFFHNCYRHTDDCKIEDCSFFPFEDLTTLFKWLREFFPSSDFRFYFMLDDAETLFDAQKQIINGWIGQRQTNLLSFKVALKNSESWNFSTRIGKIDEGHDFQILNMDELYTTKYRPYHRKIEKICEKRLLFYKYNLSSEEMFPQNENARKDFQEIKDSFQKEYHEQVLRDPSLKRRKWESTISFYYRTLGKKKQKPDYTGFDNLIHLSSGNVRQFLELCFKIFNLASQNADELIKDQFVIKPSIQEEAISDYCTMRFENLDKQIQENFEKDRNLSTRYKYLKNLIQNLSQEFKDRIKDENNPSVKFSFQYSGDKDQYKKIIQLGQNDDYFQKYFYSSSKHQRPFPTYSLNKAIAAHFGLHISSHSGTLIIPDKLFKELIAIQTLNSTLEKMIISEGKEGDIIEYEDYSEV
ncbi:MAG: hypothetical protein A2V66_09590 [Ignavibacteria bacterium RBG_13_36_8]|nr:MAG: hypothetical protein A2V66_09590 [Ignavibacteria bacterium RBG_13_36_8]